MEVALEKTFSLLLFILVGILLKKKFTAKEQINGIKNLILTVALPATIFVALMGVHIEPSMLFLPIVVLGFNMLLFFTTPYLLKFYGIDKDSSNGKTWRMLIPSLAPGLSCFPFILEFLGENALADAALADVGNKFFVLIFLYMIAMTWHVNKGSAEIISSKDKLKSLLWSLVTEPINLIMILVITLLSLGFHMENLPLFIQDTLQRGSIIMVPLVLIFIGLAVKIKKGQLLQISSLLLTRAGLSIVLSVGIIIGTGITSKEMVLLAVIFPLSSCSFWPLAHMMAFSKLEDNNHTPPENKNYNIQLGLNILAISLPLSTILILGILSAGGAFANVTVLLVSGVFLMLLGWILNLIGVYMAKAREEEISHLPEGVVTSFDE